MHRLNRNAVLGMLLVIALAVSLGFLAARPTKADKPGAAPPEVIPTAQQQKPILDLMAEKKGLDDRKEGEISGALKMLLSQLKDPVTGEVGLNPDQWNVVTDGKGGFKCVLAQKPEPKPPAQP